MSHHILKIFMLTILALIAFAANSVLCRLALGANTIDASSFTNIRLFSGAIVLLIILKLSGNRTHLKSKGSWLSGLILFLYAVTFSYAYITLDTGTGALIMFGSVQITIILLSIISGHRLIIYEWLGVTIAFLGFVYLILPGVSSPSLTGFFLMTIAGIAWGLYTLKGKESKNPLADTTFNFLRTIPFLIVLLIFTVQNSYYTSEGIILAIISGGVTSGIGYTIWYMAIDGLTKIQTAVVQLLVPIIAAFGGVIFVAEKITFRLSLASTLILGGILIVVLGRKKIMNNSKK